MGHKLGVAALGVAVLLGIGCSGPGYQLSELGNGFQGEVAENGTQMNGLKLNGLKLNGLKLNGLKLNGVSMHVASITAGDITAVSDDEAFTFPASALSGTTVVAQLEDDTEALVRIDAVNYNTNIGANLYTLSAFDGTNWVPACGTDPTGYYAPPGVAIPAVALSDTWDPVNGGDTQDSTKFTFGCTNAAIGKCVMWGYLRWTTQSECLSAGNCHPIDMSWVHQACTRLVRADYCGNGVYHTVNGTSLDVYDSLNIQQRTGVSGYSLEAEWRYDGGHCIQHTRWTKADPTQDTSYATDYAYVAATCPSRLAINDPSCTDPSSSHFYTQYGFSDAINNRSFLREESYIH